MAHYPVYPQNFSEQNFRELVRLLELKDREQQLTPALDGWDQTNASPDRTLDGSTATLADVINILGTLIQDLKDARILG